MSSNTSPEQLSINSITLRDQCDLRQLVEALARHRIPGISPWRDKVQQAGLKQAVRMIRDHGLEVSGLCRGGMFPAKDGKGRRESIDDNRRAIDEAAALGAKCLVIVAGGLPAGSRDLRGAHEMVRDGLGEVLDQARSAGVPLAIEPLHPMFAAERACINTMRHALDLCDELDSARSGAIGVAVDIYHVWWDPELEKQIERAGEKRLHAFHICDWLVPTVDMWFDRGMMGDGVANIPLIRSWMERAGYRGMHEVEILSTKWWQRSADEVLAMCRERHELAC